MSLIEKEEVSGAEDETSSKLKELTYDLLGLIGEDPDREGLIRTPLRVSKSLQHLTSGYSQDVDKVLNEAIFHEPYDEMVVVKDIEIFSLCEHHLLPFYGKAHVAYIPKGKVVGLSKIPRIVDIFAKRLQVQERLTSQIAECFMKALQPSGVAVVIEALHLCMAMRGVQQRNSHTVTSSMLGAFRDCDRSRAEFLSLINRNPS